MLFCRGVDFSRCGRYLAVLLAGQQDASPEEAYPSEDSADEILVHDLVLYSISAASAEFQLVAWFCFGQSLPVIHWTTSATLCIAHQPVYPCLHPAQLLVPTAEAGTYRSSLIEGLASSYEPACGTILDVVRVQDCFLFHPVTEGGWRHVAWSSCARLLLIHEQAAPGSDAAQAAAWLTVIDVAQRLLSCRL